MNKKRVKTQSLTPYHFQSNFQHLNHPFRKSTEWAHEVPLTLQAEYYPFSYFLQVSNVEFCIVSEYVLESFLQSLPKKPHEFQSLSEATRPLQHSISHVYFISRRNYFILGSKDSLYLTIQAGPVLPGIFSAIADQAVIEFFLIGPCSLTYS
jgi:hypothetical protein